MRVRHRDKVAYFRNCQRLHPRRGSGLGEQFRSRSCESKEAKRKAEDDKVCADGAKFEWSGALRGVLHLAG